MKTSHSEFLHGIRDELPNCWTADPGSSPVLHGIYGHDAGPSHSTARSPFRANCCALSTHRARALLQGWFNRYIVKQCPSPGGNPRDTGRLAYKKCPADNLERHGLLTYLAGLCSTSLVVNQNWELQFLP